MHRRSCENPIQIVSATQVVLNAIFCAIFVVAALAREYFLSKVSVHVVLNNEHAQVVISNGAKYTQTISTLIASRRRLSIVIA